MGFFGVRKKKCQTPPQTISILLCNLVIVSPGAFAEKKTQEASFKGNHEKVKFPES